MSGLVKTGSVVVGMLAFLAHATQAAGAGPLDACQWPTVGSVEAPTAAPPFGDPENPPRNPAVLIHPRVVLAPGSAMTTAKTFVLGHPSAGGTEERVVPIRFCESRPGDTYAFTYCVLDFPVIDIPITPVAMGCDTHAVVQGARVVSVGLDRANPKYGRFSGEAKITGIGSGFLNFNLSQPTSPSECPLGTVFVQLRASVGGDDSWRVVGTLNYAPTEGCESGVLVPAHDAMEWLEGELAVNGIDLTPCSDVDGTWNPGPDCGYFPIEPAAASGNYGDGCVVDSTESLSDLCGPAYRPEEGDSGETSGAADDPPASPNGSDGDGCSCRSEAKPRGSSVLVLCLLLLFRLRGEGRQ